MTSIFVAYSKNRVIGRNNDLPWYIPEDLKRFKKLTTGHTVIMGRNTYVSIINRLGQPLPGRRNIVISSSLQKSQGVEVARSLEEALGLARTVEEVFIIGGERVYRDSLEAGVVDKIYATEIDQTIDGDVFFPAINKKDWHETSRQKHQDENYKYSFVVLEHQKWTTTTPKLPQNKTQP